MAWGSPVAPARSRLRPHRFRSPRIRRTGWRKQTPARESPRRGIVSSSLFCYPPVPPPSCFEKFPVADGKHAGGGGGERLIVRHDDQRQPVLLKAAQQGEDGATGRCIEIAGRLVR